MHHPEGGGTERDDRVVFDSRVRLEFWESNSPSCRRSLAIYDRAYLQANIAGGEGFDWFYASPADRDSQTRTPITDGAYG